MLFYYIFVTKMGIIANKGINNILFYYEKTFT